MLAMGRGLISDPQVLLLDEPSMGLAPQMVKEILRILKQVRDEFGTMVILVEQNVKVALQAGDRACVMEKGRIVLEGKAGDVLANPLVQSTYLGHVREDFNSLQFSAEKG